MRQCDSTCRDGERGLGGGSDAVDDGATARARVDASPSARTACQLVLQGLGATGLPHYRFSAAVKTAAFNTSAGPGDATVCVQWDDHNGKWLGGQFPHGPDGPNIDWTTVGGSFELPAHADPASVAIYVYVRPIAIHEPTPTGTVFFDNVSLWFAPKPPLSSVLLSPVYRGRVTAADAAPISLRARVRLETPQTVALVATLAPKKVKSTGLSHPKFAS